MAPFQHLTPPSTRPEFSDFPEYYEREIAPYLRGLENKRRDAVKTSAITGAAIGVVALLLLALQPFGGFSTQAGFFTGFFAVVAAFAILSNARRTIADGLMSRICSKLGFGYAGERPRPHYLRQFSELKLFGRFNRESYEDEIAGVYRGTEFILCEAHLKYKTSGKNSSTRTVFHGQLIVIDYPKAFFGKTVLRRDVGVLNRLGKPAREFSRVGLASSKFESAFEAWGTDQVEARDLLDPVVLERFLALEALFGDAKIRAAFTEGQLIIALETGDKLNMGSMFEPLETPARVEAILNEFDVIFDLIDLAVTRVDGRMDGALTLDDVKTA
ncbi:MAG: DUF3137 domain-containing protein [Pseudomonadota bacterium]